MTNKFQSDSNVTETTPSKETKIGPESAAINGPKWRISRTKIELVASTPSAHEPSDFQLEIGEMTFEEFVTKTNVKDIIESEYREYTGAAHALISNAKMKMHLELYDDLRKRPNDWHLHGLKNLKFNERECRRRSAATPMESEPDEPSDFQKEVMAMDFQTFVRTTNAKKLVLRDFELRFGGKKEFNDVCLEFGLNELDKLRKIPEKWTTTSLNNLKYNNSEFLHRDVGIQCSMDAQNDQKSKQSALAIHHISESQIMHLVSGSNESQEQSAGDKQMGEHSLHFGKVYKLPNVN